MPWEHGGIMSEQAVIVIVEDDGNIADRWDQIVANLTENPIRCAAGRIRITVTTSPGWVHLNVADDGPDITPEDIPHVFERLYLSKRRPGNLESGSGLGLAIVRELVQAMSGTVSAEVTPGGGATLVLSVPSVG